MPVDIVIVNWNSGFQLLECVKSIFMFGENLVHKITVVDNGSTDNSLCAVEGVEIIRSEVNLGFAKACNIGAVQSSAKYILFLNPDARLMDGALEKVCAFMDSESASSVGICGVRLLDEKGSVQRHCARFPTWRTWVSHSLGLSALFPSRFSAHFMREFDHLSNRKVDHVIGAFFFVRNEIFKNLDGFDERYYVYLEDLDFSLRAKQVNWESFYLADAIAFHKGGGTSEQIKATRLFYSLRSRIYYVFKHYTRTQAWGVLSISLIIEPVSRLARAALRGSGQEIYDTVRGYIMLWADLSNIIKSAISRS